MPVPRKKHRLVKDGLYWQRFIGEDEAMAEAEQVDQFREAGHVY